MNFRERSALRADLAFIAHWVSPASHVLDLGCGDGVMLEYLQSDKQCIGYGIEIDDDTIPECIKRGVAVIQQDLEAGLAMFADNAFDIVVCNHVLEHIFQTENALRELKRVTQPEGIILLGIPNISNWYSRMMFLFGYMPLGLECGTESVTYGKGLGKKQAKDFIPSGHIRGFTSKALQEICEHCGLEVLNWWNQGVDLQSRLLCRYLGAGIRPK